MDLRRKTLSKVLVIALMLACAAAFTPLLTGPAFAAKAKAVKPAKVEGLELVQADTMTTANEYDVTASWTKLKKNVKKYKIKIADVTDPDAKPALQFMTVKKNKNKAVFSGTVGSTYTVKVRAIKGKKKGKWSAPQTITIAENRATLTGVTIAMPRVGAVKAGDKLTAAVDPADVDVTWQWFRVKGDEATAIDGAVSAEYTVQNADIGYFLKAVASVSGSSLIYAGSAEATTTVAVTTTTSSDGTVIPTPTPTPASDEYIEDVLTRAYNYSYPDGYKYNADSVTIEGNTLTANYNYSSNVMLSDIFRPYQPEENAYAPAEYLTQIVGDLIDKFAEKKVVTNDLSRLLGGLYYSTNISVSDEPGQGTDPPNDSDPDVVQNPITRLTIGGNNYEWLLVGEPLKASNWRITAEGNDTAPAGPSQEPAEVPTLVGNISTVANGTALYSGAVTLPGKANAIAFGQMQLPPPIVSSPGEEPLVSQVGPKQEITENIDSGNCTFTEGTRVVVYDALHPEGYEINVRANIAFADPLLYALIRANYQEP